MTAQLLDYERNIVTPGKLYKVPTVGEHYIHLHEDEIRAIQQYEIPIEPAPVKISIMGCVHDLNVTISELDRQGYTLQKKEN